MNIYEVAEKRCSFRKYKSDGVSFETVSKVLKAARQAPSWWNFQCWRFIIVDDKEKLKAISKVSPSCENAPYIIVLCANPKESGVKDGIDYFIFDSALAMSGLILAATEEGLATCVMAGFDDKLMRSMLNIPEDIKIIAMTPLGYPAEDWHGRDRKDEKDVVFHNSWGASK